MPFIPGIKNDLSTSNLMEEVQFQFLAVIFLLFPKHCSSQKSQLTHKRKQRLNTALLPLFAPAGAKTIDQQRNL